MQDQSNTKSFSGHIVAGTALVFLRAQVSAFTGGVVDYVCMILLTTYGHIFYGFSILVSGSIGAVINFSVNRYWTFKRTDVASRSQLQKFIVVVIGSILLKSSGTWLLTKMLHLDYRISRLFIDLIVSLGFNFMMQRYWVFSD